MNYSEALEYIHGTYGKGTKSGIDNMRKLLGTLGNPHYGMKFVHVAGTNGKGSTVSFISRILMEAGYRTGKYISPYLERFEERMSVDGKCIEGDVLGRITAKVKEAVELMLSKGWNHPTEFEIVTAIGFMYFREKACDVIVLEAGLGGRLDSTNAIDASELSVITSISKDHTRILGETIESIAYEKAGIIKCGGHVLLKPQDKRAEEVVARVCKEKGAALIVPDMAGITVVERNIDRQVFHYGKYKFLEITLAGLHQLENAALAVSAAELLASFGYGITEKHIRDGLKNANWPGRMEVVNRSPIFIIDGAHNEDGSRMLARSLEAYFPGRSIIFIMGVMKDKDYVSMLKNISHLAKAILTVTPPSNRALSAELLEKEAKNYCNVVIINDTIKGAVLKSLEISGDNDIICAFGSLYFLGEIRNHFRHNEHAAQLAR
jgi:dihydrofolate synthase/folylpolyglutamate synthase